ncbi:MAG: hypothetical protein U1E47_09410 [Rivihabitans pingtungensis]
MHPDAPLWVSLLLLPAFAARGVWRVVRSGDGVALAMLIASWFMLAIGFKLLRPSLAVSALWLPCFYPYLWQGVFAGGWLLCRPDPLALPAARCWPAMRWLWRWVIWACWLAGCSARISAMPTGIARRR